MIYEGKGVVTSKRWETVRDGVEDYTLLQSLKQAVDAAEKSGVKTKLLRRAWRVLNEEVAVIAEFNRGNKFSISSGQANARKVADKRWDVIRNVRREIEELLLKLQK